MARKMNSSGSLKGVKNSALNKKPGNTGTTNPVVKGHGRAGTKTSMKRVNTPKP